MANGLTGTAGAGAGNTHPGTPNGKKGLAGLFSFFKGNPFFSGLLGLLLLAFILPPRKRKQKRKKSGNPGSRKKSRSRKRKRKTGTLKIVGRKKLKKAELINNTGNPGKKKKSGKKIPRSTGVMPERFRGRPAKGSNLAKEKMEWLRNRPGALHLKKK